MMERRVRAIRLSPIFPFPMRDFDYDVADYCNVDSRFGTLAGTPDDPGVFYENGSDERHMVFDFRLRNAP